MAAGLVDAADDERRLATILGFWARAASAYRFDDGTHQASDAHGAATPYRARVDEIAAACEPVADPEHRDTISRLNALLTSYLFLLWFDTRSGYRDTGPYPLRDGRTLLLRAYNRLGVSHFPWSAEVSAEMPHHEVLGAFVLRAARLRVTDFGTSLTQPEDYWPCVDAFAFFDVSSGSLVPIDRAQRDALGSVAKSAQKQLYRKIAAMERRAKIDAGAYVYFTFLRPFAELAGIDVDWSVPRDSLDLYPLLELVDGAMPGPAVEETAEQLDRETLAETAKVIARSVRVDVYGSGASGVVAADLQQKLHRIGCLAFAWSDPHIALTSAALLGPKDVAIGISHSGTTRETIESIAMAKANGARTVAITNFPLSPLAQAVDLVLTTAARETALRSGATASRIAALTVVDCLYIAVAQRNVRSARKAVKSTREALSAHRVGID